MVEPREDWAKIGSPTITRAGSSGPRSSRTRAPRRATVLVAADVFDRPELLAANARRKIDPGTLVLVLKQRPPFAEVNVAGTQTAWVLAERLATGEKEVAVAKLMEKARWLAKVGKKDDALQALALAREHFAGVALVDALATELGEVPPPADGAAVVPSSGSIPAPVPAPAEGGARP